MESGNTPRRPPRRVPSDQPQSLTSDQRRDLFGLTFFGGVGRIPTDFQEKPDTAAHSSGVAPCHTQNDAPIAPARRPALMNSVISAPLGESVRPPVPAKLKAC